LLIYIYREVIRMAAMTRMIVSLPEDEKRWLESRSRRLRVSSAELVRRAIREYRSKESRKSLAGVLRDTAGTWTSVKGDTQDHVEALRKEWERKR
jgi:metal-responsive CopG/Arc/MetJ family transcriptional regulator